VAVCAAPRRVAPLRAASRRVGTADVYSAATTATTTAMTTTATTTPTRMTRRPLQLQRLSPLSESFGGAAASFPSRLPLRSSRSASDRPDAVATRSALATREDRCNVSVTVARKLDDTGGGE